MDRREMQDYDELYRAFSWDIPEDFNFAADVIDHFGQDSDRLALIWCNDAGNEQRFTFTAMSALSSQFANLLHGSGIRKGDRVLIMLPRIPAWQIATLGCLKLGAIPVPCTTLHTQRDIEYRANHSRALGAVTTRAHIAKFEGSHSLSAKVSVGGGVGWLDFFRELEQQSASFAPAVMKSEDPAIIYYTSGSTGHPKGVTHSARSLFTWRVSAWYWLTLAEGDVMWCTADTAWSKAGTSILFGPWSCGSTVFFYDGPFDAKKRFQLLERYKVTVYCAPTTEIRRLIREGTARRDLPALRLTVSAGESVNPDVVAQWKNMAGCPLLDGYGQTETLMTVLNYPCMPVKPGSMGRPLPGTQAAIINDENKLAGFGESGRLAIRLPNPQLMLGYWEDPERTAAARLRIDNTEWFITGDNATMDQDGYIFYNGRDDDIINSSGYRIGPMEVENVLVEHPAVQEVAVIGTPDPDRGEIVTAFIVLRDGFAQNDNLKKQIQDFAKQATAPYKYPRRIEFVSSLPRTVTGKVRRNELRKNSVS